MGMEIRYTRTHEWVTLDNDVAAIGLTDYAKRMLGDIVMVLLPKVGSQLKKNQEMCVIDSVKSATEIYSPVSGTVIDTQKFDPTSTQELKKANSSGRWIIKVRISDPEEFLILMDDKQYEEYIESLGL